jgi:hypothetical protein
VQRTGTAIGTSAAARHGATWAGDALLSHFAYEERELVEPLARLGSR